MPIRCCQALCLLGLIAAGCSRDPILADVSGVVRIDGKPMSQAMVEFVPDNGNEDSGDTEPSSMAFTDENGRYTLKTYTDLPGAVVGNHRVAIVDLIAYPPTDPTDAKGVERASGKPRVPDSYRDILKTPLRKTITAGAQQTIDIDVDLSNRP